MSSTGPGTVGPRSRTARVVLFAVVVAFVPWLVGGAAAYLTRWRHGFPITGGGFMGFGSVRWVAFADDWFLASSFVLPFVVGALITVWLWATPLESRWAVALLDAVVFGVVTLLLAFGNSVIDDTRSPVEYGAVALLLAFVTLQLPLCFVLSAWLAVRLGVLAPRPMRRTTGWQQR